MALCTDIGGCSDGVALCTDIKGSDGVALCTDIGGSSDGWHYVQT